MPSERIAGAALIAGALASVVTMALHPTAGDLIRDFDAHARTNVIAHSVALAGVALTFFGALGLTRRLSGRADMAVGGLVLFGLAGVAALCAGIASGMIAPPLIAELVTAEGPRREALAELLRYNGLVNQGFAGVFVVASSGAILLWSGAVLGTRALPWWLGVLGVVVGGLVSFAFLSGHVGLDVHGFGLIVLAQAIWLVGAGTLLARSPSSPGRRAPLDPPRPRRVPSTDAERSE
jgi:hypothetical protein